MEDKKKILVIDDNPTLCLAAKSVLQKHGYEVTTAENGPDGIRIAKEIQPLVIILDIVMPEMDARHNWVNLPYPGLENRRISMIKSVCV